MQSLALEPSDPDGLYFLGRVRFELLDRPDLALVPLEQLEGIEMSDEQRQLVDDLLAEVRVSLAAGRRGDVGAQPRFRDAAPCGLADLLAGPGLAEGLERLVAALVVVDVADVGGVEAPVVACAGRHHPGG